jgi:hypothetical protein
MKRTMFWTALLCVALLVAVGCERKVTNEIIQANDFTGADACMNCHGDSDLALAAAQAQWANSKHAEGGTTILNANVDEGACERCHTAEGFIAYITGVPFDSSHYSSIGCFTCHAPHSTGTLALRVTDPVTLGNGVAFDHGEANLCATCHQSRRDVRTYVADSVKFSSRSSFGPHHSNQGDMLTGTGGYEYANYTYDNSPHSNVTANGCIDCHMSPSVGVELGGHTWTMEAETVEGTEINLVGCNVSTCHSPALEDFNYDRMQDTVQLFLDSLGSRLFAAGMAVYAVDTLEDGTVDTVGYKSKANKIVKNKDSSGAMYNYQFVWEDRSVGVHNTDYALGLLKSALNFIITGDPNGSPAWRPETGLVASH